MEQEDAEWIQENIDSDPPDDMPEIMNNKTEYKLSWTKKVGESYHKACGDTIEEVKKNMQDLESMISSLSPQPIVVAQPVTQFVPPTTFTPPPATQAQTKYTCNICGGPMNFIDAISKAGKPYKMLKCIAFPELVNNKKGIEGHSRFL
jgi:hypothetical protein